MAGYLGSSEMLTFFFFLTMFLIVRFLFSSHTAFIFCGLPLLFLICNLTILVAFTLDFRHS